MSTQATPAPANLSVRDLATTLTKPTAPAIKKEPAATAATAPKKEPASHEPPAEPTEEPGSLTTVETETEGAGPAAEGHEAAEASPDDQTATTETAEAAPAEEVAEETEARTELDPIVAEAIEFAKAQDGGKGKAEMLKRIAKVVDQRDTERNARLTAEEQVTQLRSELQNAKAATGQDARATNGVHPAVHAVQVKLDTVDNWLGFCEEHIPRLQAGEAETVEVPDGKGGKLEVGLRELQKTRRDLEHQRQELVAQKVAKEQGVQAAFHEEYQKSHATALTSYPWLKNPQSNEYQQLQTVLKIMPGFKHLPDHELAIGDFLAGKALREGKLKAPAKPALTKAAPSREPTKVNLNPPGGGLDTEETPEKEVKAKSQQFEKSGSVRNLAAMLTASRRASRTGTKR